MFKAIGNIFKEALSPQRGTKTVTLSKEDSEKLQVFKDKMETAEQANSIQNISYFQQLIESFDSIFVTFDQKYRNNPDVKSILSKYCGLCAKLGVLIVDDQHVAPIMFDSLVFSSKFFANLPHAVEFMPLFSHIIQQLRAHPELLPSCDKFLRCLFRNDSFFTQFNEKDGFYMIFNSFFMSSDYEKIQEFFNTLLFRSLPIDFLQKSQQSSTFLKSFVQILKEQKSPKFPFRNSVLYVIHYFSSFSKSNAEFFTLFTQNGGFELCNKIFAEKCPDAALEAYELLLIESDVNQNVISALFKFYKMPEISSEVRSSLIPLLSVCTKSLSDTYKKITSVAPISEWFLPPPELTKEGLMKFALYFENLANKKIITISSVAPLFILLISPPENENIPVGKYLDLILLGIQQGDITWKFFMKHQFIERFFFLPSLDDVSKYFEQYSSFPEIANFLYKNADNDSMRDSLIEKLVCEDSKLPAIASFISFMNKALENNFSQKSISLFPYFMKSKELFECFLKQARKSTSSFESFISCNGFQILQSLVDDHPESAEMVVSFLSALSHFRPYEEIDVWINSQPIDSPIFKCDQDFLEKEAFDETKSLLHLPSLLAFCRHFQCRTPMNTYLAGKYGIINYTKQNIPLNEIPNIAAIANRLLTPQTKDDLFQYPSIFHKFVDKNASSFSLFEFVPFHGSTILKITHLFQAISFWFNVPFDEGELLLFDCGVVKAFFQNSSLVITTNNDKIALPAQNNRWHHLCINFTVVLKKVKEIEFVFNGKAYSKLQSNLDEVPTNISFGSSQPTKTTMYISKAIFLSDIPFTQQQIDILLKRGPGNLMPITGLKTGYFIHDEAVFDVPYHGFSSYFRDFIRLEAIFDLFDKTKDPDALSSIFIALLNIQSKNCHNLRKFWSRMCISFVRQKEIVSNNFMFYFYDNINAICGETKTSKIIYYLMTYMEFYFVFDPKVIVPWIDRIGQTRTLAWEFYESEKFYDFIFTLIRANCTEEISLAFVPHLTKMMLIKPSGIKLKAFLNFGVTIRSFEASQKMQYNIVSSFIKLANDSIENQLFTYSQLLDYMSLFKGETALMFADLIAAYANRNPQFITPSSYACYIFSKYATSEHAWIAAFSILSGTIVKTFPKHLVIQRPHFSPAILEMLCGLTKSNQGQEGIALLQNVVASLLSATSFQPFTTKSCWASLLSLSNLGIIPTTYATNKVDTRAELQREDHTYTITREDANNTLSLCEFEADPEFSTEDYTMDDSLFPKYSGECKWMETELHDSQIISFVVSVLLSYDSSVFQSTFLEYSSGFSLMTGTYRRLFSKELVENLLIQLANAESEYSAVFKPAILITHHYTVRALFAEKITDLLSLLFNFLKTLEINGMFASFMEDPIVLNAYKEILLSAFVFTGDDCVDLFQLFSSFESVIFSPVVFKEQTFSLFWLHMMRQIQTSNNKSIRCMNTFMSLVGSDLVSAYRSDEVEKEWGAYKMHMLQGESETENKLRISRMNTVLDFDDHKKALAAKHILCQRVFIDIIRDKHSSHFAENINKWQRQYEKDYYDNIIRGFRFKLQQNLPKESVRLSPIVMPGYQPRVVVPSPFKVPHPEFNVSVPADFFKLPVNIPPSRIPVFDSLGIIETCPEFYHFQFGEYSVFEYSKFIQSDLLKMFETAFTEYGPIISKYQVQFFFYIHHVPAVVFVTETNIMILVLAELNEEEQTLSLIQQPESPVAFIPFSESVATGDYQNTSLFCGHVVIILSCEQVAMYRKHLVVHKKTGISLFSFTSPNIVINFKNEKDANAFLKYSAKHFSILKSYLPHFKFIFCIPNASVAQNLWTEGKIDNYEYLLLLNLFGGRSFFDLTQYPVFPWVVSPLLKPRDLTKPMGQLSEQRAEHYEQTYELSEPHYHYGFHYSLPGIVFWFLMRLQPFCFFGWDLNNGWDDSLRMFSSIVDAYQSASANNQSDLKELIPEMYTVPEAYVNRANLHLEGVPDKVVLPQWCNDSPQMYTSEMFKQLIEADLHDWIDLIFGYKQTGEPAIQAKNVFLPTCYHTATPESAGMEEDVFESQSINFGQCPNQLFTKPHPQHKNPSLSAKEWCSRLKTTKIEPSNPLRIRSFRIAIENNGNYIIPSVSASFMGFFASIERENEALVAHEIVSGRLLLAIHSPDFSFATHIAVSSDFLFLSISYSFGRTDVFIIRYENNIPTDIRIIGSVNTNDKVIMSAISSHDLVCASLTTESLVLWSFVTQQIYKVIPVKSSCVAFGSGSYSVGGEEVINVSISGDIISKTQSQSYVTCCCCVELGQDVSRRVFVAGTINGFIDFYCNGEKLVSHRCGKAAISFINVYGQKITVVDVRGISYIIHIDESVGRCIECGVLTEKKCHQCQKPLCQNCVSANGLCKECNDRINSNIPIQTEMM